MAIGTAAAIVGGVGALSGVLGAVGKKDPKFDSASIQNTSMNSPSQMGLQGGQMASQALGSLSGLQNDQSFQANSDLASLLQQYQQGGYMPTAQDNQTARTFAQSQFDPQRVAMNQAFQDQLVQANRSAALTGRSQNDPILRAKLAQEQTRQQAQLESQQGAFATQYAMQQPQQRLQFAEGRANVLSQNLQQRMGLANNIFQQGMSAQNQDFQQRFGQYQMDVQKAQAIAGGKFQQDAAETTPLQRISQGLNSAIGAFGAAASAAPALSNIFGGGSSTGGYAPTSNVFAGGGTGNKYSLLGRG
jgi:hypothetical protein